MTYTHTEQWIQRHHIGKTALFWRVIGLHALFALHPLLAFYLGKEEKLQIGMDIWISIGPIATIVLILYCGKVNKMVHQGWTAMLADNRQPRSAHADQ